LSGAGNWLADIHNAVKLCNKIQSFIWRVILKIPEPCPKLALRCETKTTDVNWRIWEEKCLLLLRIQDLEDGSLTKVVNQEADDKGWPGLSKEVRQIYKEIGIPDINGYKMRKEDIEKAITKHHYRDMMSQFEGSKKLQDIRHNDFSKIQDYFNDTNLVNARTKFRIRTKMLDKIPGNFKNKYKKFENGLKCNLCPEEMTQNHCKICPARLEIRENLNMENLADLVIYFKSILSEKTKTT
jgi:hypothetical protein